MSNSSNGQGHCLCGKVKFSASAMSPHIGACHCGMCRRWGGGPLLAADCNQNVSFEGQENIQVFNSSEWAERGFCKHCGTHLFYRLKGDQQYFMPVGLFNDRDDILFDHQIFIDEKPAYYDFSNQTQNMTGEDVFKKYAESQEN